ncbi:hypothetical protein [Sphingobacterium paramultivorum]|uniref:hypothetical protein n=1 Tax=Sphingobacterium paramultivorum TaxID=2886510 RepID=UPI00129C8ABB|nr:hypothetical protein [Sphingobacterium paramultivorum]
MEIEKLAKHYLETKLRSVEQRRKIDYDFKRQLEELKKNTSVEGNLKLVYFRSQLQQEEQYYEDLEKELTELGRELKPTIKEIKANRETPLEVHVKERTHFDIYINEDDELVVSDYYTQT